MCFYLHFLLPRERPLPLGKSLKNVPKSVQNQLQNPLFGGSVFGSMLGGLQKRPGTMKILTKTHLRTFLGGSWWILPNFWPPNMASHSALKWL